MKHVNPYSNKIRRGACVILMRQDGKVLLHLRSKEAWIYAGFWALVGGGVEKGESSHAAMRRECLEELGFLLFEHKLFNRAWHRKCGVRVLDDTYIARWYPWQRLRLCEGEEIRWFNVEDALRLSNLPPHEHEVLTMLRNQRRRLAA